MNAMLVPDIKHTPELEDAAIAACRAQDGQGRAVHLCRTLDPDSVAAALHEISGWFGDRSRVFDLDSRLAAATNLKLLAALYLEHVKAGNVL